MRTAAVHNRWCFRRRVAKGAWRYRSYFRHGCVRCVFALWPLQMPAHPRSAWLLQSPPTYTRTLYPPSTTNRIRHAGMSTARVNALVRFASGAIGLVVDMKADNTVRVALLAGTPSAREAATAGAHPLRLRFGPGYRGECCFKEIGFRASRRLRTPTACATLCTDVARYRASSASS